MISQIEIISEERVDIYVKEAARLAGYEDGFGVNSAFATWACRIADWNALPDDIKRIHEQVVASISADRWHTTMFAADSQKGIDAVKKAGLQFLTFPASERARLLTATSPIWDKWAKGMDSQGLAGSVVLKYFIEQRDLFTAQLKQTTTTAK